MGYEVPGDDPQSIAQGSLLPSEPRKEKHYVWFHVDATRADAKRATAKPRTIFLHTHLRYRQRPTGSIPKELTKNRTGGFTIEWLEDRLLELRKEATNRLIIVEAELTLPGKDRKRAVQPEPPITLEKSTLRRRGGEYRAEDLAVGGVNKYRWLERDSGDISVWISYTHTESISASFFKAEEERCREHLRTLL